MADRQQLDAGSSTTGANSDMQSQIDALTASITQAQQTLRQLQNTANVGVGGTTPARMRGGITVPPVSGLKVSVLGTTAGETRIAVQFFEPAALGSSTIDHYNVYISRGLAQQSQPTLIASTAHSPAVCTYQPDGANATLVIVQTVLTNGQSNALGACPTTTLKAQAPTINPTDLNIGSLALGPNGCLILSGVTFSNSSPAVLWTAGTAVYKGNAYSLVAGSTGTNIYIYWQLSNPTNLQTSLNAPTLGIDDFCIGFNHNASGLFAPNLDVHEATGHRSFYSALSFLAFNPNTQATLNLGSKTTSAATAGQLSLFNGAGTNTVTLDGLAASVNAASISLTGAINGSYAAMTGNFVGRDVICSTLQAFDANHGLQLPNQTVANFTPTSFAGYFHILIGNVDYAVPVYNP